jgi:hypothetical protein
LRDECFQCQHFRFQDLVNLCANIIAKLVASLFEHREQLGGSPDLQLVCLTTIEAAPFFAHFAKGGNRRHLQ